MAYPVESAGRTGSAESTATVGTAGTAPVRADHDRLLRIATYASVGVASVLIAAKLAAYFLSGAVSVLSSLIDSSTDLLASLVTLLSVRVSLQPPDREHRFGHGKAEPLAALAQAAFVAGSSLFLVIEASSRLVTPQPVVDGSLGVGVMVLSLVLTLVLVSFQRYVVRRTGSVAIGADRLHYTGDLLMNTAVIAALLLTAWTGQVIWDALFGFLIAAILVRGAGQIGTEALDMLMDRELPEAVRRTIIDAVLGHPQAMGVHDLRSRRTGGGLFIELHLELDPKLTLSEAHSITDQVEVRLRTVLPDAEIMIHQEPAGLAEQRLDDRITGGAADPGPDGPPPP